MHQTSYLSRHQREVDDLLQFCKPGNVGTHQQETTPTQRIELAKNGYDEELIMGISKFAIHTYKSMTFCGIIKFQ